MHTSKFSKKILLILYFLILSNNTSAADYIEKLRNPIQFPTFTILNSKEKPIILKLNKDLDKNGYVVNFWATWCVPCKKELPDLSSLDQKLENYKDSGLELKNEGAEEKTKITVDDLDYKSSIPDEGKNELIDSDRLFITPRAKLLAKKLNIDSFSEIAGTGKNNRITEKDINLFNKELFSKNIQKESNIPNFLNATINCIGIWNLTTHPYYNY